MPRFRMHRGSLADSLETTVEVDDRSALLAHIRDSFKDFGPNFTDDQLRVEPYGEDKRIDWKDHHIVTIDGYGVVGMCEGPMNT